MNQGSYINYLIDPSFLDVNKFFVFSVTSDAADVGRKSNIVFQTYK